MDVNAQQPYSRGYRAFFDGFVFGENPYEVGTIEYNQWRDGYNEAASDDEVASGDYDDDEIENEFDSLFDNPEDDDDF